MRLGLGLILCVVRVLSCNQFITGGDYGTRGGVLLVRVRLVGCLILFALIDLSHGSIITGVARFLDCSGCMFYLFQVIWHIAHAVFSQRLLYKNPRCDGIQAQ